MIINLVCGVTVVSKLVIQITVINNIHDQKGINVVCGVIPITVLNKAHDQIDIIIVHVVTTVINIFVLLYSQNF